MATITDGFVIGMIMIGGISLCVSGFSKKGLPLSANKRITGRPAKLIGISSLILSVVASIAWMFLKGAMG
ncbi:MAG: hypothetical protein HOP33_06765 [Verrucomicrobia bacterium]|nr:hypothetical protein [Verrucomicrobiota bacterium]